MIVSPANSAAVNVHEPPPLSVPALSVAPAGTPVMSINKDSELSASTKLLVIVSAMAGETNRLLSLAQSGFILGPRLLVPTLGKKYVTAQIAVPGREPRGIRIVPGRCVDDG